MANNSPVLPVQLGFTPCSPPVLVVVHPYGKVTQRPTMRKPLALGHRGLGGRDSPVGNPVRQTRPTRGVGSSAGQLRWPAWLPPAPAPGSSCASWRPGGVLFGSDPPPLLLRRLAVGVTKEMLRAHQGSPVTAGAMSSLEWAAISIRRLPTGTRERVRSDPPAFPPVRPRSSGPRCCPGMRSLLASRP